jgi:hypothetical protein
MTRLGSLRSGPLGVRSFRLLAGGQFTSTIGDYCYAVALPWLVLSNRGGAILLGTGNAISTAAVQAGSLLGPALGGALVAATHASTWAFGIDAASFAVSALTLALIPAKAAAGTVSAAADEAAETGAGDGRDQGVLVFLKRSRVLQILLGRRGPASARMRAGKQSERG